MPLKPGQAESQEDPLIAALNQGTKRRAPARQYIPKLRSGAWAILRALETFPLEASVTKTDIIRVARQFCDTSFDTPVDNKYYTAWNSMKTVLEKGYVYKTGNPPKYTLTEEGLEIAQRLVQACEAQDASGIGGGIADDEPLTTKKAKNAEIKRGWIPPEELDIFAQSNDAGQFTEPLPAIPRAPIIPSNDARVLPAGSYTVKLIVDNREIHKERDLERLELGLREGGVDYSLRSLDVGDAVWIAKSGNEEYVLDYIVERKRMDDLVGSIKDGRFHEQKVINLMINY
jgi:crossover junction endonuclease MUS81